MEEGAVDAGSAALAGGEGDALAVAISSRALFDLGESHELFEHDGTDAFVAAKKAGK